MFDYSDHKITLWEGKRLWHSGGVNLAFGTTTSSLYKEKSNTNGLFKIFSSQASPEASPVLFPSLIFFHRCLHSFGLCETGISSWLEGTNIFLLYGESYGFGMYFALQSVSPTQVNWQEKYLSQNKHKCLYIYRRAFCYSIQLPIEKFRSVTWAIIRRQNFHTGSMSTFIRNQELILFCDIMLLRHSLQFIVVMWRHIKSCL